MKLMDKIRNESREREREAMQRQAQSQPADEAVPVHVEIEEPTRPMEEPAGKLSDADVEDAVEIQRRDTRPDGPADSRVERHAEQRRTEPMPESRTRRPSIDEQHLAALFSPDVAQGFKARWDAAQIGFVDDPRQAVKQADELVSQVMKSLAQTFADERHRLEAQMNETASTENLRMALQRYRSFFQRLLSL